VVVLAGLEAVVVVVVVPLAGLLRLGAVGAIEGLWANATEAVAARMVSDLSKVVGVMVAGIVVSAAARRQALCINKRRTFLLVKQS
jgi:hypothetical protein